MKLLLLLLRKGGYQLALASLASVLCGASSAGLIAVINTVLLQLPEVQSGLLYLFIALCLALWLFQFASWALIIRLSQSTIRDLRIQMTRQILDCPLQHLETLGSAKLLAALTEDINSISAASTSLALLAVNGAILLGVFCYLFWLSPRLFAVISLATVTGFSFYSVLQRPGIGAFQKARQTSDILFGNFRTVTEGIKELKLNRQRRLSFIEEEIQVTANRSMHYWNKAITAFAFAGSSGIVMLFIPIGWLLFFVSKSADETITLIPNYAIAILYLFTPLGEITNAFPQIANANVALEKVNSLGLALSQQVIEPTYLSTSDLMEDWTSIKLANIHHVYGQSADNHTFALDNINLMLRRGKITFITGGNGV